MPGSAPPAVWLAIVLALSLWWIWPWLERQRGSTAPPANAPKAALASVTAAVAKPVALVVENPKLAAAAPEPLAFDPVAEFAQAYAEAAGLIEKALDLAPRGAEYAAATAALHCVSGILDRLFQAWGGEEMTRVTRLREDSEAFSRSLGRHSEGNAALQLLALAGYSRGDDGIWVFAMTDHLSRLKALTLRLCLHRLSELQRLRGTMRWVQSSNSSVVPKPGDSNLLELLEFHRSLPSRLSEQNKPSLRERNLEVEIRSKITARRAESGRTVPLVVHEGLTGVARALANAERTKARKGKADAVQELDIQDMLSKIPLPPGIDVASLHWNSDELPRLFGMTSSTGRNGSAASGKHDDDSDQAAEVMAREATAIWAARQANDLAWRSATIIGVGAALDYTINRGFAVALLVGFEGLSMEDDKATVQRREEAALRRRSEAKAAEAVSTCSAPKPSPSFGAKVHSLGSSSETRLNPK